MIGAASIPDPPRPGSDRIVVRVVASIPVVVAALAVACYVLNYTVRLDEISEWVGRPVRWTWPTTVFLGERLGGLIVAVCLAVAVLRRRPMAGWLALGFVPVSVAGYLQYLPAPLWPSSSSPFPESLVLAWTAAAGTLVLALLVPHVSVRRRDAPRVFAGATLLMVYLIAGDLAVAELFRATYSWRAWWGELVVYPATVTLAVTEVALLVVIAGLLGGLGHRLRPAVALIAGALAAKALFFATFLDGPLVSACGTGNPRVAAVGGLTIASTTLLGAGLLLFERWRAARSAFGIGAVLGLAAVAAGFSAHHSGSIWGTHDARILGVMVCCFACLAVAVAAPSSCAPAREMG